MFLTHFGYNTVCCCSWATNQVIFTEQDSWGAEEGTGVGIHFPGFTKRSQATDHLNTWRSQCWPMIQNFPRTSFEEFAGRIVVDIDCNTTKSIWLGTERTAFYMILKQWFSTFLMVQPFIQFPMWWLTYKHKIVCCYFMTVICYCYEL